MWYLTTTPASHPSLSGLPPSGTRWVLRVRVRCRKRRPVIQDQTPSGGFKRLQVDRGSLFLQGSKASNTHSLRPSSGHPCLAHVWFPLRYCLLFTVWVLSSPLGFLSARRPPGILA